MEKYNANIKLIKQISKPLVKLKRNQYYVLMVEDEEHKHMRSKSEYFNYDKGYIGLERTDNGIYISKDFYKRRDLSRGYTFLSEVKNIKECCIL